MANFTKMQASVDTNTQMIAFLTGQLGSVGISTSSNVTITSVNTKGVSISDVLKYIQKNGV